MKMLYSYAFIIYAKQYFTSQINSFLNYLKLTWHRNRYMYYSTLVLFFFSNLCHLQKYYWHVLIFKFYNSFQKHIWLFQLWIEGTFLLSTLFFKNVNMCTFTLLIKINLDWGQIPFALFTKRKICFSLITFSKLIYTCQKD